MDQNLYVIGFMGTGKTAVSEKLSEKLGMDLQDMDLEIERRQQMPVSRIFELSGEAVFRDMESALVQELASGRHLVISCGGGAVLRRENVERMRESGILILLTAAPETIFARVSGGNGRPVLNGNMNVDYIASLLQERMPVYEAAADITVVTDEKEIRVIADEICEKLEKTIIEKKNF